jgi:hypothetical protein
MQLEGITASRGEFKQQRTGEGGGIELLLLELPPCGLLLELPPFSDLPGSKTQPRPHRG